MTSTADLFANKAKVYASGRPSYAPALLPWLEHHVGAHDRQHIADIGCGTGQLARLLLAQGYRVVGVEPNAPMRTEAISAMVGFPAFTAVAGRAESTGIPDHGVDGIVIGTAFHWFEPLAAALEFQRVLKPNGWITIVANERLLKTATDQALADFLDRYKPAADSRMRPLAQCSPAGFLGTSMHHASWPLPLQLTHAELAAMILSRSYMPDSGDPAYPDAVAAIAVLFAAHAHGNTITLSFETVAYATREFSAPHLHRQT